MKVLVLFTLVFIFSCSSESSPYTFPPDSSWKVFKEKEMTVYHKGGVEESQVSELIDSWAKAFKGSQFFLEKQGHYIITIPDFPKENISESFKKDFTNVTVGTSKKVFGGQVLEIRLLDKHKKNLLRVITGTKKHQKQKMKENKMEI